MNSSDCSDSVVIVVIKPNPIVMAMTQPLRSEKIRCSTSVPGCVRWVAISLEKFYTSETALRWALKRRRSENGWKSGG